MAWVSLLKQCGWRPVTGSGEEKKNTECPLYYNQSAQPGWMLPVEQWDWKDGTVLLEADYLVKPYWGGGAQKSPLTVWNFSSFFCQQTRHIFPFTDMLSCNKHGEAITTHLYLCAPFGFSHECYQCGVFDTQEWVKCLEKEKQLKYSKCIPLI